MTANGLLQIALYLVVLVALVKPLGLYMARVYAAQPILIDRALGPLERLIYRIAGVRPNEEMSWKRYAFALLLFSTGGVLFLYALQRAQGMLPLNPQHFGAVAADSSLNTAISFTTNTNWQGYGGETTISYLTQMLGMTVQNFVSAASGMAVLIALIRGITRRSASTLGNFWVDLVRTTLYILLPLAIVLALLLVAQGTVQNLNPSQTVNLLQPVQGPDGAHITQQTLAMGPAASQVAIKHLGTNGGGFFNANAAHPFENPTPLTDFILILAETMIPAALTYTFGKMARDTRQGWAILAAMLILLGGFMVAAYAAEAAATPQLRALHANTSITETNTGGNMEGKEVRIGIARSALFATATTATSSGAVNSMHDSFTPLGGAVALFMMHMGETVLGGVGSGLYGMLAFVLVAVFMAGLMVGRTPEYLGKKIEAFDIKMISLAILVMPLIVLAGSAAAVMLPQGRGALYDPAVGYMSISNRGPHALSQVLYAFTSAGNNNGSAFAGLGANNPFYNVALGLAMLMGRFMVIIPILALAGSLAHKKFTPAGLGTLPTHTPLFVTLLIGIVLIVGALTFLPALALGPIAEHLLMIN